MFWSLLTITWFQRGSSTKGALSSVTAIWGLICHHPSDLFFFAFSLVGEYSALQCECERKEDQRTEAEHPLWMCSCGEKAVVVVCVSGVLKSRSLSEEPSQLKNDSRHYNILSLNGCWTGWSQTWQNNHYQKYPCTYKELHFKMYCFI